MTWPAAFFYPHRVKVRDVVGIGSYGPIHMPEDEAREVVAEVLDEQTLVRTADADEVVSSSRVTVPLDADIGPGALVKVWEGTSAEREAIVLTVGRDDNDPPLTSHLVLRLQ